MLGLCHRYGDRSVFVQDSFGKALLGGILVGIEVGHILSLEQ